MDINIRYARLEDYDAVENIMKQVQQLHVDLRPDIYRPVDVVMDRSEFEESVSRNCFFAAEVNGYVAGIASVLYRQVNVPHMIKRRVMFIETLAVDAQYRRMGIGKALLDYLNRLRKEQNLDGLELQVNARNTDALQMYKDCGFTEKSINMELID